MWAENREGSDMTPWCSTSGSEMVMAFKTQESRFERKTMNLVFDVEVDNVQGERSGSEQTAQERGGRKASENATEGRKREFQEVRKEESCQMCPML